MRASCIGVKRKIEAVVKREGQRALKRRGRGHTTAYRDIATYGAVKAADAPSGSLQLVDDAESDISPSAVLLRFRQSCRQVVRRNRAMLHSASHPVWAVLQ